MSPEVNSKRPSKTPGSLEDDRDGTTRYYSHEDEIRVAAIQNVVVRVNARSPHVLRPSIKERPLDVVEQGGTDAIFVFSKRKPRTRDEVRDNFLRHLQ